MQKSHTIYLQFCHVFSSDKKCFDKHFFPSPYYTYSQTFAGVHKKYESRQFKIVLILYVRLYAYYLLECFSCQRQQKNGVPITRVWCRHQTTLHKSITISKSGYLIRNKLNHFVWSRRCCWINNFFIGNYLTQSSENHIVVIKFTTFYPIDTKHRNITRKLPYLNKCYKYNFP